MTCTKSQGFLAEKSVVIQETVDARKQKFEGAAAVTFVREADEVFVAKGQNVRHVVFKNESITDEELLKLVTGPSGNLRAPTIRRKQKLFVGFHSDEYEKFLK